MDSRERLTEGIRQFVKVAAVLFLAAGCVSAGPLDKIIVFVKTLTVSIKTIGNSLAIVMFVYGGAKYIYSADDPGARKQAIGICVAAMIAMIIIQSAESIIAMIPDSI